jgi:hypothetical protein
MVAMEVLEGFQAARFSDVLDVQCKAKKGINKF